MSAFRIDRRNRKIMGVAAGVAAATGWDVLIVRIVFVLLALTVAHVWGVLLYLLVGLLAPAAPRDMIDLDARD